uniref:Glycosyl transferase family 1 n=2 Tax=Plesiomonas shigelloides TaxID=703 RepID=A0A4D6U7H0_PLESH|nr:glycosyl transferase family 1 [Plesiomonas shigelloides]
MTIPKLIVKEFMNIILIVDRLDWAFGKIAENIKSKINKENNVSILCTSKFSDYGDFLEHLNFEVSGKPSIIHFYWRDYLFEALEFSRLNDKFCDVFIKNKITTHIPDHLFTSSDPVEYEKRVNMMKFIDGYFTTSSKLFSIYCDQNDFNKPEKIIYDAPKIDFTRDELPSKNEVLKVVWIGNSRWGEHLGFLDYKGLESIVIPAIKKIKKEGFNVEYIELDSYKEKTTHENVLGILRCADVLLISSEEEGTPLPLIEAMANGCAIITTDVGIASEILPEMQKQFIVDRECDAFYEAIKKINENRELLLDLKIKNKEAYEKFFVIDNSVAKAWVDFFTVVNNKTDNRFKAKYFVSKKKGIYNKYMPIFLYQASKFAIKYNLIETLKKYPLIKSLYYKLSVSSGPEVNYELLDEFYQRSIKGKKIIALYSSYWLGVATSTSSFFLKDSLVYPYYSHEFPQVKEHVYLDRLSTLLSESRDLKCIVMSGGTMLQMALAVRIKEKNNKVKIFFGWHGSPAQWVDYGHYDTFGGWLDLYADSVIDGIISFKPELYKTLNAFNVKSYSIANFIVDSDIDNRLNEPDGDRYTIGLFSAMFSWYKNPFPQLLAIGSISGGKLVTNLQISDEMNWITQNIDVVRLGGNVNNSRFIKLLSKLHVVSYITNTECSPMIALEAAGVGTPCVVGPAGNIYKGHKELEYYLVEAEVDNPTAIKERLILVRDNYKLIRELLENFVTEYNLKLELTKQELYKELTQ